MALALSKQVGESFQIGTAIVTIMQTRGETVRVSIVAPDDVKVIRACPNPSGFSKIDRFNPDQKPYAAPAFRAAQR